MSRFADLLESMMRKVAAQRFAHKVVSRQMGLTCKSHNREK